MELHAFRYPNLHSAILGEIFSIRFQPHQVVSETVHSGSVCRGLNFVTLQRTSRAPCNSRDEWISIMKRFNDFFNDLILKLTGSGNHEEIFTSPSGGYVRCVYGRRAFLYNYRVYVQWGPAGLFEKGRWKRKTDLWQSHIHLSTGKKILVLLPKGHGSALKYPLWSFYKQRHRPVNTISYRYIPSADSNFHDRALELRQYKNDSTESKSMLILKLPRFSPHRVAEWRSAPISKQTYLLTP